jgi:hypothetical protein
MARAELPDHAHQLSRGEPVIPTQYEGVQRGSPQTEEARR